MSTLMEKLEHMTGTKGAEVLNEAEGIVEAFVAGIGNKDSVADIVEKGAFEKSLQGRKPRVVWGHDWNHPIGKVLEIREVPAGDASLPAKMREAQIGGLFAKVQFNLLSEKGREAFNTVAFFGEEQEWSIGYKTLKSDYDPMVKANRLKEIELFEVSPVLHGANQLTGTVSVKSGAEDAHSSSAASTALASHNITAHNVSVTKSDNTTAGSVTYTIGADTTGGTFYTQPYTVVDGQWMLGTAKTYVNEEVNESENMLTKDLIEGYTDEAEAADRSAQIGCSGTHMEDGSYFPCEDSNALRQAMRGDGKSVAEPVVEEIETETAEADLMGLVKQAVIDAANEVSDTVQEALDTIHNAIHGEVKSDPLYIQIEDDSADIAAITDSLGVYAVTVKDNRIVFNTVIAEEAMKSALAEVLADHGVTSVSVGRQASSDAVE